jgi:ABC-type multidrug transport system fused ATPase/permease subunit
MKLLLFLNNLITTIKISNCLILLKKISYKRKFQLILLFVFILLSSIIEILSIGSIAPLLSVLLNSSFIDTNIYFTKISKIFNFETQDEIKHFFAFLFLSMIFISLIIKIITIIYQTQLGQVIGSDITKQIYHSALYSPYEFHQKTPQSEMIAAVTTKSNLIVTGLINPLLVFISQSILIIFILTGLIFLSWSVTLIAFVFLTITYLFVFLFTKKQLQINSRNMSESISKCMNLAKDSFKNIKTIIIHNEQNSFITRYAEADKKLRTSQTNSHLISYVPRLVIEFLALFMILIFIIIFVINMNGVLVDFLPLIAILLLSFQKLLPASSLIFSSYSTILHNSIPVKDALNFLSISTYYQINQNVAQLDFKDYINLKVTEHFVGGRMSTKSIKNIDITIKKNQYIGIVGASGSGKSTVLNLLSGLIISPGSQLILDGEVITEDKLSAWYSIISYVTQDVSLTNSTIIDNIISGTSQINIDYKLITQIIELVSLDNDLKEFPNGINTLISEDSINLSGGQKQRIGIARALYRKPKILFLDEATSALDYKTEQRIVNNLKNFNLWEMSGVIVSHRPTIFELCDIIYTIESGIIIKKQEKLLGKKNETL